MKMERVLIEKKIVQGNKENGVLQTFRNGKLISEVPYCDGKIDGRVKTYYEDGKIESIRNYKNGKLNGMAYNFDARGNVTFSAEYIEGSMVKTENEAGWSRYDCLMQEYEDEYR